MFRNSLSLALVLALCGAATGQEASSPDSPQELEDRIKKLEQRLEEVTVTATRVDEKLEDTPILDALRSVEVYGFVNAAYSFNLRDPSGRRGRNGLRLSDPDHNTFGIPYAKLGLARRDPLCILDAGGASHRCSELRRVRHEIDNNMLVKQGPRLRAFRELVAPTLPELRARLLQETRIILRFLLSHARLERFPQ